MQIDPYALPAASAAPAPAADPAAPAAAPASDSPAPAPLAEAPYRAGDFVAHRWVDARHPGVTFERFGFVTAVSERDVEVAPVTEPGQVPTASSMVHVHECRVAWLDGISDPILAGELSPIV